MKKTRRWVGLLNILVEKQSLQTVAEFAKQVAVSSRTTHSDLQGTSFLQLLHGAELIKKPSIGIRPHCAQKQGETIHRRLQKNRLEVSVPLEKRNDSHAILHMLLTYRDAVHIEDLTDALYRSKSSLVTVLEETERLTENYDRRLRERSNYGPSLEGHEEGTRGLFYHFAGTLPIQGYQHNDLGTRLPDALYEKTRMVFDVQMIWMIIPTAGSSETNLSIRYYDYDFDMLIPKCCTSFTCCQIGRSVQRQTAISTDLQKYCVATVVKLRMERTLRVSLPEEEIYYLERVILSTRKQQNREQLQELDSAMLGRFIYLASERLNVDLSEDKQLKQNLCNYTKPAIRRVKCGISSESPLPEAVKMRHTEVHVVIMATVDKIEEREHIYSSASELGFVCLHIVGASNRSRDIRPIRYLLICDAEIAFESYVKSIAEASLCGIEIMNVIGGDEMREETGHQHSLTLNTTMSYLRASNITNVNHLFTKASYSQIRHQIFAGKIKHTLGLRIRFNSYPSYFQSDCESCKSLVHRYCIYLKDNGHITKTSEASVYDRIQCSSTTVGRGIVVPCGARGTMKSSAVLTIKLDHAIMWDGQLVDLVFFAAIGEDISMEYSKIFHHAVRVVSDDEQTRMLKSYNSLEEIRKYLFDTEQKV